LHKEVNKDILPPEYGGNGMSIAELTGKHLGIMSKIISNLTLFVIRCMFNFVKFIGRRR
jgi:hypothetical protein